MEFRTKREAEPLDWKRRRLNDLADGPGPSLRRRAILGDAWAHWHERQAEAARIRALLPTLEE